MSDLTDDERALLLEPCECGHTINDHGELMGCWQWLKDEDRERDCETSFAALLVARVGVMVERRVSASLSAEQPEVAPGAQDDLPGDSRASSRGSGGGER